MPLMMMVVNVSPVTAQARILGWIVLGICRARRSPMTNAPVVLEVGDTVFIQVPRSRNVEPVAAQAW